MNPPLTVESLKAALDEMTRQFDAPIAIKPTTMVVPMAQYRILKKREKTLNRRLHRTRKRGRSRMIMNMWGYMVPREWA